MVYRVSVKFGENQRYELALHERDLAGATPESARHWLTQQFQDMGCEPSNPTGKVLLVDKVLGVAKAIGEKPFAQNDRLAQEFSKNALLGLEKNALSIDLTARSVG